MWDVSGQLIDSLEPLLVEARAIQSDCIPVGLAMAVLINLGTADFVCTVQFASPVSVDVFVL